MQALGPEPQAHVPGQAIGVKRSSPTSTAQADRDMRGIRHNHILLGTLLRQFAASHSGNAAVAQQMMTGGQQLMDQASQNANSNLLQNTQLVQFIEYGQQQAAQQATTAIAAAATLSAAATAAATAAAAKAHQEQMKVLQDAAAVSNAALQTQQDQMLQIMNHFGVNTSAVPNHGQHAGPHQVRCWKHGVSKPLISFRSQIQNSGSHICFISNVHASVCLLLLLSLACCTHLRRYPLSPWDANSAGCPTFKSRTESSQLASCKVFLSIPNHNYTQQICHFDLIITS